jgi:DNA-binding PadR family transcriptional regulator
MRSSGGSGAGEHFGGERGGLRRGGRPFDYGDLRLIVLGMIAAVPRHGYEIMKAIEARMGGSYSPSPGVVYPTLAWLEDMGYAAPEAEGGRKSYRITPEGEAFVAANREALAALEARMGEPRRRRDAPEPVMEAMGALKRALRTRFQQGPVDDAAAARIAAAIQGAANEVEATMTTETGTKKTGMVEAGVPESGTAATDAPAGLLASTAVVTTPKAAGYAAQLCKHFAHKIPARFEDGRGEIEFAAGICRLAADGDRLTLRAEADGPDNLARLEGVVARHLVRFAFREELQIDWQRE